MEPTPSRIARILHGTLAGGMAVTVLVLSLVPATAALGPGAEMLLTYLVFALAGLGFAGALVLVGRLQPTPADREAWWRANTGRAIVIWTMIEGPCVLAAVVYYLGRNPIPLVIPAAGLVLFALTLPARLEPA